MRAAIFVGSPELSVEEVTPIDPGPRDVIVRIGASGVCHSDVSVTERRRCRIPPPCILGHEGAGTVEWVGPEVSRVEGRVTGSIASFVPACGVVLLLPARSVEPLRARQRDQLPPEGDPVPTGSSANALRRARARSLIR